MKTKNLPDLESAVLLCGGLSTRMGVDKGLIEVGGEPFVLRIAMRLLSHFNEVVIVFRHSEQLEKYSGVLGHIDVRMLTDEVLGMGPLAGLLTGLEAISGSAALVTPCDAPLVNDTFIENMKKVFRDMGDQCDVIVPERGDGLLEPLHAVYKVDCTLKIRAMLAENKRRVLDLINSLNSCRVPADRLDPSLQSFMNFNRPEDLRI